MPHHTGRDGDREVVMSYLTTLSSGEWGAAPPRKKNPRSTVVYGTVR